MKKPTYIEAEYHIFLYFNVKDIEEEYNIKWSDVEDWYVKGQKLSFTMKDGTEYEWDAEGTGNINLTAFKRPSKIRELDKNYHLI